MKKYFILLWIILLMTLSMNAQIQMVQKKILPSGDLTFDAILYFKFTITGGTNSLIDTLNQGIHLAPVDTILAVSQYSAQLRARSTARYGSAARPDTVAGFFDARAGGSYPKPIDTVRYVYNVPYECWLSVHFWLPGSDSISKISYFMRTQGKTKIDTICLNGAFRNNSRFLRIWSLIQFDAVTTSKWNLDLTTAGSLVDNVGDRPTSVKDIKVMPTTFEVSQNYPNPFNPETRIQFSLLKQSNVRLSVYNMLGQVVNVLVNGELTAGTKEVVWNGADQKGRIVTSGVYLYKLETPQGAITKKMIMMK